MNPWLEIPLNEYEGHMNLPSVGQAQFLSATLESWVQRLNPESIGILGCAGGNGFETLPPSQVRRVVGVDINPSYIAETHARYRGRFHELELYAHDFLSEACAFCPVDLMFAGLLFEYIDVVCGLSKIKQLLRTGGHLGVILQLPHVSITSISPSPFQTLEKLGSILSLVSPGEFESSATSLGFQTEDSRKITLTSGKAFHQFLFTL